MSCSTLSGNYDKRKFMPYTKSLTSLLPPSLITGGYCSMKIRRHYSCFLRQQEHWWEKRRYSDRMAVA